MGDKYSEFSIKSILHAHSLYVYTGFLPEELNKIINIIINNVELIDQQISLPVDKNNDIEKRLMILIGFAQCSNITDVINAFDNTTIQNIAIYVNNIVNFYKFFIKLSISLLIIKNLRIVNKTLSKKDYKRPP